MNKKDQELLYELDQDCRRSLHQLSKKVHLSEQVINYRIKKFHEKKIVSNYFTVIDIAKIGYTSYRVMIQLSNSTTKTTEQFVEHLKKHPNILWVASCGGRYDFVINMMAKNIRHFNTLFNTLRSQFSRQIQNYTVLTTIEVLHLGREYLKGKVSKTKRRVQAFGQESEIISLDKIDYSILNEISEQARKQLIEISQKLKVSANTVTNRIRSMRKKGIIQGFKPLLHLENIGINVNKILIKLHNVTLEKEKNMYEYAINQPNVTFIVRVVGQWDLELEVETKTRKEFQAILMNIRDQFSDIVKEIETIPIYQDYRYNYFPKDFLKKFP